MTTDTAEIETFLVLAEQLHFGRTAERPRLEQPRVSRLIARLERRVGGALFDRTSRPVRLTPLGGQLCSGLQLVYAGLTAALEGARVAADAARPLAPAEGESGANARVDAAPAPSSGTR
jgi:DNA-binding transcriptional LysR family regulator